ncbi:hypothetical protein, partial [Mesorhizobium sp.]|uniref:hypothetical protein n=1 Tax=Mesorhizobium sp. TaxID=1871066 RepID=UPI0025E8C742
TVLATRVATAGREVMREVSVAKSNVVIVGLLQTRTDKTRRSALATAAVPASIHMPSCGHCQFAIGRLINPTNVSNLYHQR